MRRPPRATAPDAPTALTVMLAGRRIVLGVTGGIAAYKAVEVCRRLVDAGAHVAPIMTSGARHFVGETTFSALASEPVQTSLWDEDSPIPHTRLGQGADLIVVAPATARLLSDYASGRSSDLLTATLLATRAPVVVCPAMHTEMWEHPAVQENLAVLRRRGVLVVEPEAGRLAGGDVGHGRLASPDAIVAAVDAALTGAGLSLSVLGADADAMARIAALHAGLGEPDRFDATIVRPRAATPPDAAALEGGLVLAAIAEGYRLVEEAVAGAEEIERAMTAGAGWAAGPFTLAGRRGLRAVVTTLAAIGRDAAEDPAARDRFAMPRVLWTMATV